MKKLVLIFLFILLFSQFSLISHALVAEEKMLVIGAARALLGTPYRYGGSTLKGLDCSAFVRRVFSVCDIQLPRTAKEQLDMGVKIARHELEEGDLVFFRTSKGNHVGIFIGEDQFIHASSSHRKVRIDSLSDVYFRRCFVQAVRIGA